MPDSHLPVQSCSVGDARPSTIVKLAAGRRRRSTPTARDTLFMAEYQFPQRPAMHRTSAEQPLCTLGSREHLVKSIRYRHGISGAYISCHEPERLNMPIPHGCNECAQSEYIGSAWPRLLSFQLRYPSESCVRTSGRAPTPTVERVDGSRITRTAHRGSPRRAMSQRFVEWMRRSTADAHNRNALPTIMAGLTPTAARTYTTAGPYQ